MKTLLILGDIFLAIVALYTTSIFVSNSYAVTYTGILDLCSIALFVLPLIFSSFLFDLYNHRKAFSYTLTELATMIFLTIVVSILILSIMNYLLPAVTFRLRIIFFTVTIFGMYQFGWRIAYKSLICSPALSQRILVIGSGERTMKIASLIASSKRNFIMVECYDPKQDNSKEVSSRHISSKTLTDLVKKEQVDMVVVAVRQRRGSIPLRELLDCKLAGIEVVDATTFYEELQGKLLVEDITPGWFIFSDGFRLNNGRKRFKRMGDIICALSGVILSLPFVPILAFLIKLDSKGPVFLSQARMGEGERLFNIYKFRTMRVDAESQTGAVWAQKDDCRITRVGRILRKLRIDELPQFYNVLKGDMSFIGPRPERPEFVERLRTIIPYYSERHCVKPGITGWAQVMYSYGASDEDALEKLRYDLYYIKNLSFQLECTVILETIKVILFGRGSR
jgi:sugar transferase (PEP-CTERM system associated)